MLLKTGNLAEMDNELHSLKDGSVAVRRAGYSTEHIATSDLELDRSELARTGKKQVLKVLYLEPTLPSSKTHFEQRNFDLTSMIGFSSVVVSLWESVLL